jgi:hypothetical protein
MVTDKLGDLELLERNICVVSELPPRDDDRVTCVTGDYSSGEVLARVDWEGVTLALIFFERHAQETEEDADIRNVLAAILSAEHLVREDARLVVEVHDEKYISVLRHRIGPRVEVTFKERIEADLIANTIINRGGTARLIAEIASSESNRIVACPLTELTDRESVSVEELKFLLLEADEPRILLGMLPEGENSPILNPAKDSPIGCADMVYYLSSTGREKPESPAVW